MNLFPEYENDIEKEWHGMPEFSHVSKEPVKQLVITFDTEEQYNEFQKLIDQPLSDKTQSVWWPKAEIEKMMDKRYENTTKKNEEDSKSS